MDIVNRKFLTSRFYLIDTTQLYKQIIGFNTFFGEAVYVRENKMPINISNLLSTTYKDKVIEQIKKSNSISDPQKNIEEK